MISLSVVLLVRFSQDIYHYRDELVKFNSDALNKLFYLNLYYLENVESYNSSRQFNENEKDEYEERLIRSFLTYLDSLEQEGKIFYRKGYRNYPWFAVMESSHSFSPRIYIEMLNYDFTEIIKEVQKQTHLDPLMIKEGSYIYLNGYLAEKLLLKDEEIIFVRRDELDGKYVTPLRVKIVDSPHISCFLFADYLNHDEKHWLKFNTETLDEAVNFAWNRIFRKNGHNPVYIGLELPEKQLNPFIVIKSEKEDNIADILVSPHTISQFSDLNSAKNILMSSTISHEKGISVTNSYEDIKVIEIEKERIFEQYLQHNISGKHDTIFKFNGIGPQFGKFYAIVDFQNGYSMVEDQLQMFDLLRNHPDLEFITNPVLPNESNKNIYIYYDDFNDVVLSREIMENFTRYNINWDSGRWQNIVILNESLNQADKRIGILLSITVSLFIIFLIVKFYLKLKLDFHTIGTLRTFGYRTKELTKTYIIGYVVLVTIGFVLGLIFSVILTLITRSSLQNLNFIFIRPINPVSGFFLLSISAAILVISGIVNKLLHSDNIYELIKYEN